MDYKSVQFAIAIYVQIFCNTSPSLAYKIQENKNKGDGQNDFIILRTSLYHELLNAARNMKIKGACLKWLIRKMTKR